MSRKKLTIATRGSALAVKQARQVRCELVKSCPDIIVELLIIRTTGDKINYLPLSEIGGKGLFVKEIEEMLLNKNADLAVHSMKDMPTQMPPGLTLAAVPLREDPADILILREKFLSAQPEDQSGPKAFSVLPQGARVGTSSTRRKAQLLANRPDLRVANIRGNLDTRLRKLKIGDSEHLSSYDALILAQAGISRLQINCPFSERLDPLEFIPAAGQGALGVQCREDDHWLLDLIFEINHAESHVAVMAERAFLAGLSESTGTQTSCQTPVGALASINGQSLDIVGFVATLDGSVFIKEKIFGPVSESVQLGDALASRILDNGGRKILTAIYNA